MSTSYPIITTKYSIRKSTLKNIIYSLYFLSIIKGTWSIYVYFHSFFLIPSFFLSFSFLAKRKFLDDSLYRFVVSFSYEKKKTYTHKLRYEGQLKRGRIIESLYCHTPSLASGVSFIRYMILDTVTNALYLTVS